MFRDKNLTDLRSIAMGFGVEDVFSLDRDELEAGIEIKRKEMLPPPAVEVVQPEYDARLMNKPPSKKVRQADLENLIGCYRDAGLVFSCDDEMWYLEYKDRTDQGSLRMPIQAVLRCVKNIMK